MKMQENEEFESNEEDEDIKHILSILPKEIEENVTYQKFILQYIKKLGTFNIQQLNKEIQILNEGNAEVSIQTRDLAVSNYKKFIQTAEYSRNIFQQFQTSESILNDLLTQIPQFENDCKAFSANSNDVSVHRKMSTLTFSKNQQLAELLSLPQLMEKVIDHGDYEVALEIVDYVRRLSSKHSNINVFHILLEEVEKQWLIMIQNLLSQLRTDIQLPKCLQAVGYLRCMHVFSEAELRLKFLQTRDSCLQNLLEEIPKDKAAQHLSKTIEISRNNIFHIITQYNAIFSDDLSTSFIKNDSQINECTIFQSWITEKISQFLKVMDQDLSECDGSAFHSILSQCMNFGLSFSRVGCDFRALAAPIITKNVLSFFKRSIDASTKKFKKDMECFTLINKVYSTNNPNKSATIKSKQEQLEKVQDFYPLAEYCNGILSAFNDLRTCAPIALIVHITQAVEKSLIQVSERILLFYQQEHQAFTEVANDQFSCFCKCFVFELIPHVQTCLQQIYPLDLIAMHMGVSAQVVEKAKYLKLDRNVIVESIQHLLPVKIDTEPITELLKTEEPIKEEE